MQEQNKPETSKPVKDEPAEQVRKDRDQHEMQPELREDDPLMDEEIVDPEDEQDADPDPKKRRRE